MNYKVITAESDLGVDVNGSKKGPNKIVERINIDKNKVTRVISEDVIKENNKKIKNLVYVNDFNEKLYEKVYQISKDNYVPITLGGDHSIVIGSALASIKRHKNLGIIWIDSHGDYNTFETTESGNIHGLPFAAITGYKNKEIVKFHDGNFYDPKKSCLVGARDLSPYELEKGNLLDSGITIFTTEDIKKYGAKKIMENAFKIANNDTDGIHISYDIDVIDPEVAPGVSVPAVNGINENEAYEIADFIRENIESVKSLDIVEYNPDFDLNDKTLDIATNIFNIIAKR